MIIPPTPSLNLGISETFFLLLVLSRLVLPALPCPALPCPALHLQHSNSQYEIRGHLRPQLRRSAFPRRGTQPPHSCLPPALNPSTGRGTQGIVLRALQCETLFLLKLEHSITDRFVNADSSRRDRGNPSISRKKYDRRCPSPKNSNNLPRPLFPFSFDVSRLTPTTEVSFLPPQVSKLLEKVEDTPQKPYLILQ